MLFKHVVQIFFTGDLDVGLGLMYIHAIKSVNNTQMLNFHSHVIVNTCDKIERCLFGGCSYGEVIYLA